ncbi:unnamed protein product [Cyprideis torosa]|uniref:Uncharacterized protein n=1 Tax=Cyprideis torosa TaxID=163714 RepID=A0A7R8WY78_9CRUS|nr:unnamed protein product [Cyprideis torosa]CAG0909188.1 unnamed protein product [Cyprideis torosa]
MLAKVITWGKDREEARSRMVQALDGYHIEGVLTNIDFANQILTHPEFIDGQLTTAFIPTHLPTDGAGPSPSDAVLHAMALAATLIYHLRETLIYTSLLPLKSTVGGSDGSPGPHFYKTKFEERSFTVSLESKGEASHWQIDVEGVSYEVQTPPLELYRRRLKLTIDGQVRYFRMKYSGNFIEVAHSGVCRTLEVYNPREWQLAGFMPEPMETNQDNVLICPMPGMVVEVKVQPGEMVFRGQELIILESMKMESAVAAPIDGVVEAVNVASGDAVETGSELIRFVSS